MSLQDLKLRFCYDSGPDSLANDFYIPCMQNSVSYDRAVGFFSSSVFEISWRGLRMLLSNGGSIRLICSHILQNKDLKILSSAPQSLSGVVEESLLKQIDELMASNTSRAALQVFAFLVAKGKLKIKIAIPESNLESKHSNSIFHSKVGIFKDSFKQTVVFKGSSNESKSAFSDDGNSETVDVYCSWINEYESKRVKKATSDFESLWNNSFEGVRVFDFPEAVQQKLVVSANSELFEKALAFLESGDEDEASEVPFVSIRVDEITNSYSSEVTLRRHQASALEEWKENQCIGLMEHATGSGKTITGLMAAIYCLNSGHSVLIIVPSTLLLKQWNEEFKRLLRPTTQLLLCGDGNNSWKNGRLYEWMSEAKNPRIVLSTLSTATSDDFISQIRRLSEWGLIADEVHRLGSAGCIELLNTSPRIRLGLSATPTRSGDAEGTNRILKFFEKILPTKFHLRDAIEQNILTPYHYSLSTVELTDEEMEKWISITKRIVILSSNSNNSGNGDGMQLQRLLIERFRIIKGAEKKIPKAAAILKERYRQGERWIVYCDSISQIEELYSLISKDHTSVSKYYSGMDGDPQQTLKYFESVGGIVLSVKCLDEGVDIPAASHALIIASSQNPREFIQRRGRILRKSNDKTISYITDLVTLPNSDYGTEDSKVGMRFLTSELSRAALFARDSINSSVTFDIERIAERFKIDIKVNSEEGIETDSEDENG